MRSLSGAPADPITLPIVACSPYSQGDPANFFSLSATNTENGWGTGKTPFHVQGWFDAATTGEQPDPYGMHTLPYFDQITLARPHTGATDDCHECGRLKLRCDRRSPCGACVKRGVTDRCKYPPNASEKMYGNLPFISQSLTSRIILCTRHTRVTADCHEVKIDVFFIVLPCSWNLILPYDI
ncbi:hypothetical protein BD410DRAFT_208903 [Rickenella mellea]|uniref:Zn(2)-C6 fungal-type domain-containing protein n=1 Tax=Rickenella mellea TaxID=50990 RepID=A0A4Y7Q5A9_9AGAM|nr:hypothetical protein BD410DRAFT_208903 [Rickenella mellea]